MVGVLQTEAGRCGTSVPKVAPVGVGESWDDSALKG